MPCHYRGPVVFPDDVLVEGERVVAHRHPHWRVLLGPALAFLLVVGAAGYVAALARNQGWQEWGWPAVGGLAVTAAFVPVSLVTVRLVPDGWSALAWLWVGFGVVFIGGRALVLLRRARTERWMVPDAPSTARTAD